MTETHSMDVLKLHPTGVQEWLCRDCGRHLAIQAAPFKRIVLDEGDFAVAHTGGTMSAAVEVEADAKPATPWHKRNRLH